MSFRLSALLLLSVSSLATTPVVAQMTDSTLHRIGLFADIDYSLIDYAGIKYRLSNTWAVLVRTRLNSNDDASQYSASRQHDTYSNYEVSVGAERVVLPLDQLLFLVYVEIGYGQTKSTFDHQPVEFYSTGPFEIRDYSTEVTAGVAAEYFFESRVSMALRCSASHRRNRSVQEYSLTPAANVNSEHSFFSFGRVLATLSLYL
jgi:hypothetical protein